MGYSGLTLRVAMVPQRCIQVCPCSFLGEVMQCHPAVHNKRPEEKGKVCKKGYPQISI